MPGSFSYESLLSRRLPLPPDRAFAGGGRVKYEFGVTLTDPDTFPVEGLWQALGEALRREGRELVFYPPAQGHEGLRELIAQKLWNQRGAHVDPADVFLSGGALGAINALLDVFLEPGDVVLVESYTYLGVLNMLLARRARVVHLPTDDKGMDTEALERAIRDMAGRGERPKLIFIIPVYQNPLGVTMSLERRRRLLEIAQEYGVPVLEDDVYADLKFEGELPPTLYGMDRAGCVLYVSSFSKLAGCGVRLGYAVVPKVVMEKAALVRFGGTASGLASMTVYEYLRHNLEDHIEEINASLKMKRDAMLSALGEYFPPSCDWSRPQGGMHIWVRLPQGGDTLAVLPKAVEMGVRYNPGPLFHAQREGKNRLRLCFSYNTREEIREGVALLSSVLEREGLFGRS
ncbi:MAG: PLP-dependent aminotransferase family protein [Chloroflexi bacterium]|nr:PLP-dependent aminotransferase family protein [Chloroflexota bacterium]